MLHNIIDALCRYISSLLQDQDRTLCLLYRFRFTGIININTALSVLYSIYNIIIERGIMDITVYILERGIILFFWA
jgi:hypothetical protein